MSIPSIPAFSAPPWKAAWLPDFIMSSNTVKVCDLIVEELEKEGVRHIFLLSGGMMLPLLGAVGRSKKIAYVCHHHEQAAAMAAEGYAREKLSLGVCLATSGPAATNTLTGVAGAYVDSSPVLILTAQSRTALTVRGTGAPGRLRTLGNFEIDIVEIAKPITKYAAFVDKAEEILFHLHKAIHLAKEGRPGPVLLDLPLDIQGATVDRSRLVSFVPPVPAPAFSGPGEAEIALVLSKLKGARRPFLLAGHGVRVSGAARAFRTLVEKLGIPVGLTALANDLLPYDHPLYVGKVGLRGDRAGNFAAQNADVMLILGSSLHVTTTGYEVESFAPDCEKIVVDIDAAILERNHVSPAATIHAPVDRFVDCLLATVQTAEGASSLLSPAARKWTGRCRFWKAHFRIIDEPHLEPDDEINPYRLVEELNLALTGDETVLTDSGSLYYIMGQAFRPGSGNRLIVSGAFGGMGFALPASIGAAMAAPGKKIVHLTGDGSFQMNSQELATIARYQPNILLLVVNNSGYASIRNSQVTFGDGAINGADEKSGVAFPDFGKLAEAYRLPHRRVSRRSELAVALRDGLAHTGPLILEIVTPSQVQMIPAVTSVLLPSGTFKSMRLHEMSPLLTPEQEEAGKIDIADLG